MIFRDSVHFYHINLSLKAEHQTLRQAIWICAETKSFDQAAFCSKYDLALSSLPHSSSHYSLCPHVPGSQISPVKLRHEFSYEGIHLTSALDFVLPVPSLSSQLQHDDRTVSLGSGSQLWDLRHPG